jgi:hypothetical protein
VLMVVVSVVVVVLVLMMRGEERVVWLRLCMPHINDFQSKLHLGAHRLVNVLGMMLALPSCQARGLAGLPARTLEATEVCVVVGLLILGKKFTPAAMRRAGLSRVRVDRSCRGQAAYTKAAASKGSGQSLRQVAVPRTIDARRDAAVVMFGMAVWMRVVARVRVRVMMMGRLRSYQLRVCMDGVPMDIRSACGKHSKSMRWHRRAAPFLLRRLLHRPVPLELTFELLLWLLRLYSGSFVPQKAVAVARTAVRCARELSPHSTARSCRTDGVEKKRQL